MRVTNSMMVASTKININGNKTSVDQLNRQLANQKKIVKPSDDPVLAIRSLRLRSSLSTIDQYYERNIPDTESWMDVTETALVNIKDIISKSYEQVVYGATDELNNENRLTIQKELKALQEQVYTEGNAEYAGRTVFTGYKTNHKLTFTDEEEAEKADYAITEHLSYQDIEKKAYFINQNKDTTADYLLNNAAKIPKEYDLNRIRLSYDKMESEDAIAAFKYQYTYSTTVNNVTTDKTVETKVGLGKNAIVLGNFKFTIDTNTSDVTPSCTVPNAKQETDGNTIKYYVENEDGSKTYQGSFVKNGSNATVWDADGNELGTLTLNNSTCTVTAEDGSTGKFTFSYTVGTTTQAQDEYYKKLSEATDNQVYFNYETGELLLSSSMSDQLESKRADVEVSYNKIGFDVGEVRPENFFDCVNKTDTDHPITYQNYDEDGAWITEGIYYNIANKQAMQINTEARDVFSASIYRDMDELIDIVNMAIDSQSAVDSIKQKLESGLYDDDTTKYNRLKDWLDAANKQLDYAVQNMHDAFSSSITTFQGYLEKVTLAVTDAGSRGERVALTKTRMNVQQTTFEELKSVNEDADLSDLMIDYSAAYVSYQAALQAAGKIGKMTLLDYI